MLVFISLRTRIRGSLFTNICADKRAILRAIAARMNSCHFICKVLTNDGTRVWPVPHACCYVNTKSPWTTILIGEQFSRPSRIESSNSKWSGASSQIQAKNSVNVQIDYSGGTRSLIRQSRNGKIPNCQPTKYERNLFASGTPTRYVSSH